jgi:hypothetical protein
MVLRDKAKQLCLLKYQWPNQNVNFSASCTSRGGAAFTTCPKVPVPKSPLTAAGPKN